MNIFGYWSISNYDQQSNLPLALNHELINFLSLTSQILC